MTDLHYLIAGLRFSDLLEFSNSYRGPLLKLQAARGILFKGFVYKADFQDFLLNPAARLKYVDLAWRDSHDWYYNFAATNHDMTGVVIDWDKRTIEVPPGVSDAQKAGYEGRFLHPRAPDQGRRSAYLKYWFGKIYERYRGSGTRIIFFRLPRGPFVRPDQPPLQPHSSVRDLAARPGVILSPEHFFDSLEKPEWFMDQTHFNGPGSALFSRMLGRHVRELLGSPDAF